MPVHGDTSSEYIKTSGPLAKIIHSRYSFPFTTVYFSARGATELRMTSRVGAATLLLFLVVAASGASQLPEGEKVMKVEEINKQKRSDGQCNVNGRLYRHGEVFTMPGLSECLQYRCIDGRYDIVREACPGWNNAGCVPINTVATYGCRSLRCVVEDRGSYKYYYLQPTTADRCEYKSRCMNYNTPFDADDCVTYRCVATGHGGYNFQPYDRKCRDDINKRCVSAGTTYSKYVNGYLYRNCVCQAGGGYSCRG